MRNAPATGHGLPWALFFHFLPRWGGVNHFCKMYYEGQMSKTVKIILVAGLAVWSFLIIGRDLMKVWPTPEWGLWLMMAGCFFAGYQLGKIGENDE